MSSSSLQSVRCSRRSTLSLLLYTSRSVSITHSLYNNPHENVSGKLPAARDILYPNDESVVTISALSGGVRLSLITVGG
ncbi:hypothetical protein GYMLUDRAFT_40890 [Collybiopsis luxurians FD-317 M1]|uniref:Uncharacterized protein n=1 Tax=Collybiopsis luxurians FD-317 M1 TaxID=944289 RepID=A0A0D0BIA3_9AGAR|nr:hypothetical protein GYMLUDRAFT_40890 [Collybiopsis luxurians FD-317 M1]